ESAVAVVMEQGVLHSIIGNEHIRKSVAIVIGKSQPHSRSLEIRDPCFAADIAKRAISIIVKQDVGCFGESPGRAISTKPGAALRRIGEIAFQVARNEQ